MITQIRKYKQIKNEAGTIQHEIVEDINFNNEDDLLNYYESEVKRIKMNKLIKAEKDVDDYIRLTFTGKIK